MKKLIVWALLWVMMPVMAAPVTLEQVNKYAQQQYRNRWKESALSIRPVLAQNDEGGYTYTATVRFSKKSAEEVYAYLAAWAAETMDTVLSADPATGEIQAQQYLYSVASQVGGFYRFHLCLRPTVTLRAMKGEAQITVSLQYYEIVKTDKGVVNMLFQTASGAPLPAEQWLLADRYPYNERGKMPLATAEAFTKSYAYIQLLLEQLR
ncbi:MAG: hypothetical protein IK073_07010 [Paludibacteraceae bacterium]|nr:hypothetical protein [Paludibacteraceae bacterium]